MLGIRIGWLRSCVEGVPAVMVLVAIDIPRRKPEGNEGEEKKVAAKEGCRQSGGYSYESMKDREHARRNLNNSCDTIPWQPARPPTPAVLLSNHPYVIKHPPVRLSCPRQNIPS